LALDEPSEERDEVFEDDGLTVVVEKRLMRSLGGVRIDFQTSRWMGGRFSVVPSTPPPPA
jgi:Fe-S cluster assembly iron-binding protein IscA